MGRSVHSSSAMPAALLFLLAAAVGGTVQVAHAVEEDDADPPTPPSDPNSKVLTLDATNWNEVMDDPEHLLMVEFYAPWCGHCKQLAPEYERTADSLDKKFPGRPLLAKISLKYRVMSYPTLLLFAPGIDGEPFADSRNMGILKGVMIGLVQDPSRLEAKRKLAAEKAAGMAALMEMDGASYDTKLGEMRELSTLTYMHAKFCQDCESILGEFAKAAATLVKEGYPEGVRGQAQL